MIGIVAIACVVLVFCCRKLQKNHRLFAISIIVVIVAVSFSLATGELYRRYLAVFSPLLICVMVVVLSHFISRKPGILILCMIFFGISIGHIAKTMGEINIKDSRNYSLVKEYVHLIDQSRNDADYVVLDQFFIPPGAYGYFGSDIDYFSGFKFFRGGNLTRNRLKRKIKSYLPYVEKRESFIGFTKLSYQSTMEKVLGSVEVLKATGEYMVWRGEIASAMQP